MSAQPIEQVPAEVVSAPSPPSGSRPSSTRVPQMPALSPRNLGTPRGSGTPRGGATPRGNTPRNGTPRQANNASVMSNLSVSPRLLESAQSGRRNELLTKYVLTQEQEPWGIAVKEDVDKYRQEQHDAHMKEKAKRDRFRVELSAQIEEHERAKTVESKRKEDEMKHERDLFNNFRRLEQEEKRLKREKHLKEIEDRKEHLSITSARRERELQREAVEEQERRVIAQREAEEALGADMQRRTKQKDYSKEMWEYNLQVKALKERQRLEEQEHDKALMAEYIRITDEERKKRAAFIKSRQRPTNPNLPRTNAEKIKEEKMQKFINAQLQQQEYESKRLQRRFEQDKEKKIQQQIANERYLSDQIEARKIAKEKQRQADLEERRRLDEDTKQYYDSERQRKQNRFNNSMTYSSELEGQMATLRERQLLDIVASPPKAQRAAY